MQRVRVTDSGGLRDPEALYIGYKVICRITQVSKLKLEKKKKNLFALRQTIKDGKTDGIEEISSTATFHLASSSLAAGDSPPQLLPQQCHLNVRALQPAQSLSH